MSEFKDYLEEENTYVKFSARPTVRWNSEEWGVYIFINDGSASEAGAMFTIEQAEQAHRILRHAIEMARSNPPIPDLLEEEF
jgi:hypothetical protein